MNKLTIIIVFTFMLGCKQQKETSKKIKIDLNQIQNDNKHKLYSEIKIIPLKTDSNCLIGHIDKIVSSNGRLAILDKQQKRILQFDSEGNFVNNIQKVGKGVGEYTDIHDFDINLHNNNVEIISWGNLLIYSNKGVFIKKIKISTEDVPVFNRIICINKNINALFSYGNKQCNLFSKHQNKTLKTLKFNYPKSLNLYPKSNEIFYKTKSYNYYCHGYPYDIYEILEDEINLKYSFDFGNANLNIENKGYNRRYYLDLFKKSNQVKGFLHYYETDKFILGSFLYNQKPIILYIVKKTDEISLYNCELGALLSTGKMTFTSNNEIILCLFPHLLKQISQKSNFFNDSQIQKIQSINNFDNPVLLKIKFNN